MITFEPTLILYSVLAGLNTAQELAAPIPQWAHAVILIVTAMITAILNRSKVSPA